MWVNVKNRAKRKYGTVAQEIQFSKFYRTAIILKPFLFDYTITKDAQVKRLRLPRRKRGGKTEIPMQGLAGFAWGFLFLRLRDGGGIYFLLLLSSAVSSAGIQLLLSQPPLFTLLPERSRYPLSFT